MRLIEVTQAPCLVCGRGNTPNGDDHERPIFVDLERDVNWNDPAVLCEGCCTQIGALVGMMGEDEKESLEGTIKRKDRKIHQQKAEIDKLHVRARQLSRAHA
jgi:hypothetical protein